MIFDNETLYSDDQAITATAVSTNVVDGGATTGDLGKGRPIPIRVQVTEAFDLLTSLQFDLQVDDNEAMASAKVVQSQTVLLADLVAGKVINFNYLPKGMDERYSQLNYTVVGTAPTAGKVTAGIVMEHQDNP